MGSDPGPVTEILRGKLEKKKKVTEGVSHGRGMARNATKCHQI